ncbi:Protein kinase domain - like 10 [Theobroma cacao]|nr:Protein kinase domain - like 10 [Theobroma cacao]
MELRKISLNFCLMGLALLPHIDAKDSFPEKVSDERLHRARQKAHLHLTQTILHRIWRRFRNQNLDDRISDVFFSEEFVSGMGPRKFSVNELARVTRNFKDKEKLGEGGFGAVYRGYLRDLGTYVAVKRVSKTSKQGIKEYASEVKIISRSRHKNLVKLIGWCHEKGELILVYEFMANGSLDSHLFKSRSSLTWEVRFKIVRGLASALFYLHEEGDHCVLHRDIKTSNIMLDSSFNAKLGDFGLARLVDHGKGSQTTLLAGTMGYMAPECFSSGKASKESDVYSFGVVILEIACGRRSIEDRYGEYSQVSLVAWVWDLYGKDRILDVADRKLSMDFDSKQMECVLMVGLWCAHPNHNLRPSIRQAIQALNFEAPLPNLSAEMPIATYDVPTASSDAFLSNLTITIPR